MSNEDDDSVTKDILNLEVEQCEDEEPEPTNENVNRVHQHNLSAFNKLCDEAKTKRKTPSRKRSNSDARDSGGPSAPKQQKLDAVLSSQVKYNANLVTQAQVDDLLIKFMTEALMPFSMVEQPAFKEFVLRLQPNRSVMCRATVVRRISDKASLVKKNLKEAMDKVEHVATTTDCWSAHGRSFIGVTGHWINPETLERKSCVLVCRRLKDNGSNFVKAFSVFAEQEQENHDDPDKDEECQFEDVFDDLTQASAGLEYQLPPHQRCAAHTLNLISTSDAEKAEADGNYKRLSRSTFAKCSSLWNKSSRSVQVAEMVKEKCGLSLIKPNATQWNSIFMAVQRIIRIIKGKGENVIHSVCSLADVPKFKPAEISFLNHYVEVMKPVAQALNILQGETNHSNAYMGYLAPTITILRDKLSKKLDIPVTKPLVQELLNGIDKRFDSILKDKKIIAAAILYPKFKESWSTDCDVIER
ncbi:zinc finger BED domain-containing 1-like, partial [Paramuricea clavata]